MEMCPQNKNYNKSVICIYFALSRRSVLKLKALTDEPWESFEAMKEFPWFKDSPLLGRPFL